MSKIIDHVSLQQPLTTKSDMALAWGAIRDYASARPKISKCRILVSTTTGMAYFIQTLRPTMTKEIA